MKARFLFPAGLLALCAVWFLFSAMGRGDTSNLLTPSIVEPDPSELYLADLESRIVRVPAGQFIMGTQWDDNQEMNDEGPPHNVSLSGFGIFRSEFTSADYLALLQLYPQRWIIEDQQLLDAESRKVLLNLDNKNTSFIEDPAVLIRLKEGRDAYPVNEITWYGAAFACNLLSDLMGYNAVYNLTEDLVASHEGVRLPTEAQWEWAAQAAESGQAPYPGDLPLDELAWYGEYSRKSPYPVELKQPNALGLYDMAGNLYEWCQDWYGFSYYSDTEAHNPQGTVAGRDRVIRGGAYNDNAFALRITYRFFRSPGTEQAYIGFRPVFP